MTYKQEYNWAYDYLERKHPDWSIEKLEYWSEQAAKRLSKVKKL